MHNTVPPRCSTREEIRRIYSAFIKAQYLENYSGATIGDFYCYRIPTIDGYDFYGRPNGMFVMMVDKNLLSKNEMQALICQLNALKMKATQESFYMDFVLETTENTTDEIREIIESLDASAWEKGSWYELLTQMINSTGKELEKKEKILKLLTNLVRK